MSLRKLLPAAGLLLFSAAVSAELLQHPYQVREPVVDESTREQMLQRALDSLLVRLTAQVDAPQMPALASLRQAPQQLASQFGYEADGSALLVEFDPASTERALRQAGVPVWGSNRPLVLLWWLQEDVTGSQLLSDAQGASNDLRRAAQHRGLPLSLPLGDLSEQLLGADELLAADGTAREAIAERYASDVQLVVIARRQGEQWHAQWLLSWADKREQGQVQASDTAALADAVMLQALQRLGQQFIAAPGQVSDLEIWIEGANIARFAELERLLDALGGRLLRVDGQRLVYQVSASPEQIRAQMGLLRLQEVDLPEVVQAPIPEDVQAVDQVSAAPVEPSGPKPLRFRW